MICIESNGKKPVIHPTARAAETATLVGDVVLEADCSVWYGAVLRGDMEGVRVGEGTNIQDNAVLHNARLGCRITLGHAAVADGCVIEDDCLIGINATVLQGSVVGRGSLVAAGAVVTENMVIPPESLVMGVPARIRGTVSPQQAAMMKEDAEKYILLAREELPTAE